MANDKKGVAERIREPYLGEKLGLSIDQDRAGGDQVVDCPACDALLIFDPEEFAWQRADNTFEVTDAHCSICKVNFELTAANGQNAKDIPGEFYDFFGSEVL
jgi:transcription elongation factor Elf1